MLAAVKTASVSAERMRKITFMAGGDDGIRTHDPLLAKQVL
jgi:molybdopterin biosynthesis enzyme